MAKKNIIICYPLSNPFHLVSTVAEYLDIWTLRLGGRTENGERFIASFDNFLPCSAAWHELCLGMQKWTRQAWLLSSATMVPWDPQSHHDRKEEMHKSQEIQMGAEGRRRCPWGTRESLKPERWMWKHKVWCGGLKGISAEEGQWGHLEGTCRTQTYDIQPSTPPCSPLVHPGWWLPPRACFSSHKSSQSLPSHVPWMHYFESRINSFHITTSKP